MDGTGPAAPAHRPGVLAADTGIGGYRRARAGAGLPPAADAGCDGWHHLPAGALRRPGAATARAAGMPAGLGCSADRNILPAQRARRGQCAAARPCAQSALPGMRGPRQRAALVLTPAGWPQDPWERRRAALSLACLPHPNSKLYE
uniref:hypothetical protein n=1 Tax=Comamonas terrigena TaxID=32013 RepID=UPI0009F8D6D3|nr:hypothetical protein [Comamonas terrigena]